MVKKWIQRHGWWIWGAIILVLTSIPGKELPEVEVDELDKIVHTLIYFVFGYLIQLRLFIRTKSKLIKTNWYWIPASFLFAGLDEWHQHFIPGRFPSIADFIFDVFGIIAAFIVFIFFRRREQ